MNHFKLAATAALLTIPLGACGGSNTHTPTTGGDTSAPTTAVVISVPETMVACKDIPSLGTLAEVGAKYGWCLNSDHTTQMLLPSGIVCPDDGEVSVVWLDNKAWLSTPGGKWVESTAPDGFESVSIDTYCGQ